LSERRKIGAIATNEQNPINIKTTSKSKNVNKIPAIRGAISDANNLDIPKKAILDPTLFESKLATYARLTGPNIAVEMPWKSLTKINSWSVVMNWYKNGIPENIRVATNNHIFLPHLSESIPKSGFSNIPVIVETETIKPIITSPAPIEAANNGKSGVFPTW
jgi:hypothetical protein